MIDYMNVTHCVNGLVREEEKEIDGIVYRINRWTDEKYVYKRIEVDNVQAESPFIYTEKVMKLNEKDFREMLEKNGLKSIKVYGDYKLNEYQVETSPRLILLAQKNLSLSHKCHEDNKGPGYAKETIVKPLCLGVWWQFLCLTL